MSDVGSQTEIQDIDGTTTMFSGSVGSTSVAIPSVSGNIISSVSFRNSISNTGNKNLLYSLDDVTFFSLSSGEFASFKMKGSVTQVYVKSDSVNLVDYEVAMNRELY